jgi:hypothetical protein
MFPCHKCNGRLFIDRLHTTIMHIETYCIRCGSRKFYHPPTESREGRWLLQKELLRTKHTITQM